MLFDFHTHAFPDAIAPRAMETLSYAAGGLKPQTDGTVTSLKEQLHRDGVDMAVVLSIATNPNQQKKVNAPSKQSLSSDSDSTNANELAHIFFLAWKLLQ